MSEYLYEDFVSETMDLFDLIRQKPTIDAPNDDSALVEAFNAQFRSDAIITHFKGWPSCPSRLLWELITDNSKNSCS